MDVSDMVITGITAWLLASGPIALLIGQVLRRRNRECPVPPGAYDVPESRTLVTSGR